VLTALIVAALLLLCVWVSDTPALEDKGRIVGTSISLTALGLLGTLLMARGRPLRVCLAALQLGPWMGVGFTVGYGVATLAWWDGNLNYRGIVTAMSLNAGALVAATGFTAATIGYFAVPAFVRRGAANLDVQARGTSPFRPEASSVWTLFLVAMAGHLARFGAGTVGFLSDPASALSTTSSSGAIFAVMTQMGVLATLIAAWRHARVRSPGSMVLLLMVSLSQIGIGLLSAVKEAGIVQLIAVVLGLSAFGRLKIRPLVGAALLTLLVITPLVTAYRQVVAVGATRLTASQVIDTVDLGAIISDTLGAHDSNTVGQPGSWGRWSRVGDVGIIVNQSPTPIPYASPTELLVGPVLGFIPRSLWPGKPVLDAGYQINQIYYHSPPSSYSSAAPTPYGDLFRHGGIPVVTAGMLLFGGFLRLVDSRHAGNGAPDPRVLFLPMLLFTAVVKQEADYVGFTASLLLTLVTYVVAARLTRSGRTVGP